MAIMMARLRDSCVLVALLVGLSAGQDLKEGQSQVDWYFFDMGGLPEGGEAVSVPLVNHRTTRLHNFARQDGLASDYQQTKTHPAGNTVARSDAPGQCFHRGLGTVGVCTAVANCMWAARQLQHWGRTEVCEDASLVCCPTTAMDKADHDEAAFPSPSWDPYTFQYFPSCPPPHAFPHHHHQQLQVYTPPQQQQVYTPPQQHVFTPPQQQQRPAAPQVRPPYPMGANTFQNSRPSMSFVGAPAPAMAPPVQRPRPAKPAIPVAQPPRFTSPPKPARPETSLIPLIDEAASATTKPDAARQPGDVARKMCVAYERFAPSVRFGPDKDCIPNHTYPIGGNPALPREFPHFAQLGVGRRDDIQWFCGGALIAPSWILTAAHCLYVGSKQVQWVRLGDLEPDSDTDDSNPQIIAVAEAVRHPDYKAVQVYNDVALLRLAREPDMSTPHVRPACLQIDKKLKKDKLNLIGFGLTEENGNPAKVLMEVALWRTPGEKCASFFGGEINLRQLPDGLQDDSQLCAGLDQVGKDACQGDSGGPLNTPYSPTCMHSVAGVTSFGQGCGRGAPGVYTRVSHFVPWIERVVWPEQFKAEQ